MISELLLKNVAIATCFFIIGCATDSHDSDVSSRSQRRLKGENLGSLSGKIDDSVSLSAMAIYKSSQTQREACNPPNEKVKLEVRRQNSSYKIVIDYPYRSTFVFRDRGLCRWELENISLRLYHKNTPNIVTEILLQNKTLSDAKNIGTVVSLVCSEGKACLAATGEEVHGKRFQLQNIGNAIGKNWGPIRLLKSGFAMTRRGTLDVQLNILEKKRKNTFMYSLTKYVSKAEKGNTYKVYSGYTFCTGKAPKDVWKSLGRFPRWRSNLSSISSITSGGSSFLSKGHTFKIHHSGPQKIVPLHATVTESITNKYFEYMQENKMLALKGKIFAEIVSSEHGVLLNFTQIPTNRWSVFVTDRGDREEIQVRESLKQWLKESGCRGSFY